MKQGHCCHQKSVFRRLIGSLCKNFALFKIYVVSARTREFEPVRTGGGGREGQFFSILCGRLYGRMFVKNFGFT